MVDKMNTPYLFYNTYSVDSDDQCAHNLQESGKDVMIPYMKDRHV